jgi:hypothetical protein
VARDAAAQTWHWSNPLPHGNSILSMAWNGDLCVQVAESGQIYTGHDFFGWLPQDSGTTNDLMAVTFFGERIVYVGANGVTGYSDDGINFTATKLNTANWLVSVAASSSNAVAVGDNAVIYTSADGANWRLRPSPPGVNNNWLLSVAWGQSNFVVTGEGGYVATSGDGVHWTNQNSRVTNDLTQVAWISADGPGSVFPFAGFWATTYDGQALYSTDSGVTWRLFGTLASTNALYAVAANSTNAIITGDSEVWLGSPGLAGVVWQEQAGESVGSAPAWSYYTALWDTNGAYRLAGDAGMMVEGNLSSNKWSWQAQYPAPRDWLWQAAIAGNLYVAVGDNARIMTSGNGVDWNIEAIPLTNSVSESNTVFLCVGGDTNLLIAAGNRGSLAISPSSLVPVILTNLDGTLLTNFVETLGLIWYSMPSSTPNDLAGVCAFGGTFLLAGGNATMLRSADGTNWSRVSVPTGNYISGLAASSGLVVATGDRGTILTSSDGNSWTKRSSGTSAWLFRVRYVLGHFLAVGENGTILQSSTGQSWTAAVSGTTNWLNDAVVVNNTCYVVGNQGTVLASTNLSKWTRVFLPSSQSLYGAAARNGQLVVVGYQGSILRSQVVPNLTPVRFLSFGQSDGLNVFLVAGLPDQSFTLDSSNDLVHWTTGPRLDLIYGSGTLVFLVAQASNAPPAQYYRATLLR